MRRASLTLERCVPYTLSMRRRAQLTCLLIVGAVLMAGCSSGPLAPYSWLGHGQNDIGGATYSVRLVFTLYGNRVYGDYYLLGATDPSGQLDGTVDERDLAMVLTSAVKEGSSDQPCVFDLTGSIDEKALSGTIEPRNPMCLPPKGTWDLTRQE